jgi:hypothetical protein
LECGVPTLALHGINRESAGNYQLIDEESTRGRGFHRELPVHLLGFRPIDQNLLKILLMVTIPGSADSNLIY